MPVDILKIWERYLSSTLNYAKPENEKVLETGNKLDCLMNFLWFEPNSQIHIIITKTYKSTQQYQFPINLINTIKYLLNTTYKLYTKKEKKNSIHKSVNEDLYSHADGLSKECFLVCGTRHQTAVLKYLKFKSDSQIQ